MAKKHIDRVSLIAAIRELKELSNEQKSDILQLISEQKKYGLVWEDSPEEVEEKMRTTIPVLTEDKDKFIDSDAVDAPNHILVEGDNLEALTALTYTHEGKIDVIYIDPPYNTGNRDFVYNDSYVDSEDGYRHSKWLSFIEKRLKIAKKLLSERGVIFISIDDNEQANLKLLCDEVFGGGNFLAQVIWERAYSPVNLKKHFSESHDYIIGYAKNKELAVCNGLKRTDDANNRYSNPDNDPRGPWKSGDLSVGPAVKANIYPITTPSGRVCLPPNGYSWRLSKERLQEFLEEKRIWFGPEGNSTPSIKRFLTEVKQGITPMTIWKYTEVGHSQDATKELKDIFGGESRFTYPKSVRLLERIFQLYSQNSSTILDFFAGSGTTLHATMQLNAEDGGHRQCILCTNNENGICEEVTYERNKRVINGYTKTNGDFVEGLHANKLRYYKIEHVERENNVTNRTKLIRMSTDLLCVKENLYDEVGQFGSLKFKKSIARYFADANKQMLIVYEPRAVEYIANELRKDSSLATKHRPLKIYVYSDGAYAYTDEFEGLLDKVELTAMPNALSQALHNVLPEPITNDFEEGEIGND